MLSGLLDMFAFVFCLVCDCGFMFICCVGYLLRFVVLLCLIASGVGDVCGGGLMIMHLFDWFCYIVMPRYCCGGLMLFDL